MSHQTDAFFLIYVIIILLKILWQRQLFFIVISVYILPENFQRNKLVKKIFKRKKKSRHPSDDVICGFYSLVCPFGRVLKKYRKGSFNLKRILIFTFVTGSILPIAADVNEGQNEKS